VLRQREVAADRRQRPHAEAFVGDGVLGRAAHREGRVLVEEEIRAVIVVGHHDRVDAQVAQPVAHRDVGIEERLPCGRAGLAAVVGAAHGRNVRGADAGDDASHQVASLSLRVARNCS
jgi:hypothetical protein